MWLTLDKDKRNALFSIYAWMRAIDDIADSPMKKKEKVSQLNAFYHTTDAIIKSAFANESTCLYSQHTACFWPAFQETIRTYRIQPQYFQDMYMGQLQSIQFVRFKCFATLYQHCYCVASTVGLICISIWGYSKAEKAQKLAEYRGVAMQLTNIIRDINVDAAEGKLFIPSELFEQDKISAAQMIKEHRSQIIKALLEMITQAEHYFHVSRDLERYVSRKGSLSLRIMTKTYSSLLKKIKKNPSLIFEHKKINLTAFEKITLCLFGIVQWSVRG